ncbi:MAG: CARDB domain-containing protein, partial [Candidatus Krumholzibacteriia bacterium]
AVATLLLPAAAAAQANLIPNIPAGWAWPLVPRPAADATSTSAPAPTTLTGNSAATWLSQSCRNIGTLSTGSFHSEARLDGELVLHDRSWATLAPGAVGIALNGGPYTVRGGRHTLELRLDSTNIVTESSEADNNVARQWVWSPLAVVAGSRILRDAPPDPTGGWSVIPDGQSKYDNCDGFRFTAGAGWDVLYSRVGDVAADYDCLLYTASTGAANGFATPLAASRRRGAGLDGALLNGHLIPGQTFDVGVERIAGSATWYVEHVASQPLACGDSLAITLGTGEMLRLFDVSVAAGDIGPLTVTLQLATTEPSVQALWADRAFQRGALTDLSSTAATDGNGRLRLYVTADAAGQYGLVIMRDPDWGTAARSLTLKVERTKADLTPFAPVGWHSPLVPRPQIDGTPTSVALPDTLPAYNSSLGAVLNWCVRNDSPLAVPATSNTEIFADGVTRGYFPVPALGALGVYTLNGTTRGEYYAGRHTLSLHADRDGVITELSEANNVYGEQYCWGPLFEVHTGDMGWGGPAPDLDGGMADLTSGETFWWNSRGWRLPKPPDNVWWAAFAIIPPAGNDADLALHETLRGVKDGFAEPLATSGSGAGQSDYVLVNHNITPRRTFDVGVLNFGDPSGFTPGYSQSTTCGETGAIDLPPHTIGVGELVQLVEFYFTPGYYLFHLDNQTPYLSWGLTLHRPDLPYQGKLSGTAAYAPAPGEDTWLHAQVTTAGWHCLAIWQPGPDVVWSGTYQLSIRSGFTPVPPEPELPAATAIAGIHPNPFNPRATIAFDLARPAVARLMVYDLRGARVRTLVSAPLPAGRHEATWDGRDDAGRPLASGTYLARLEAGGVTEMKKMVLVK